ncbi:putative manganese-dependent inorganic diphosphatase [Opitutaceae bacterium EW11]|nr:putative manganese-dependent inorganic diphosphatase [Opitutaceae bacterium EW11]
MTVPSTSPSATPTYIVGHKNPDADAICSAIAYAALKEAKGIDGYVAARCGNSNARIDTILQRFHQPLPTYLSDVTPRVRDLMVQDVVTVSASATCAEALELIDEHDVRILPVITDDRRVIGSVSVFQLGGYFIPKARELREMRKVNSSLAHIARALRARVLHMEDAERMEELFVRIGAMDVRSFGKFSEHEGIPAEQSIIIVGDRWDIQQRSIQIGVRAVVITGNLPVDDEVVQRARQAKVSVIVSPYDSATTAWVIRTASTVERLIDRKFSSVSPDLRIADLRRRVAASNTAAYMVVSDEGKLLGILTKTDILKPVKTRLVLVDHNEMTQAVSGANEVTITEIIDHHRLGALNTQQPILFINEPVGSTCTIVGDLFRRDNLTPSAEIAGIMMGGIISDTLNLNSPTSTEKDASVLAWLSKIAGVDARSLADSIFSSGSVILANPPEKVIRTDFKIYDEDRVRFAVSQVEELGFGNFWKHAKELCGALERLRENERLAFACLLITDINTQNSLLMVKGDADFISRISYPHVEKDEIFDLPGIVSRKKQLIPYITSLLREMQAEGASPSAKRESAEAASA